MDRTHTVCEFCGYRAVVEVCEICRRGMCEGCRVKDRKRTRRAYRDICPECRSEVYRATRKEKGE